MQEESSKATLFEMHSSLHIPWDEPNILPSLTILLSPRRISCVNNSLIGAVVSHFPFKHVCQVLLK